VKLYPHLPTSMRIRCEHAHELISSQMDRPDPLRTGDRFRLWLHLKFCAMCTRVESQMHFMREAMKRLGN